MTMFVLAALTVTAFIWAITEPTKGLRQTRSASSSCWVSSHEEFSCTAMAFAIAPISSPLA